nr:hypothetical protein [Thiolapillus sp.]
MIDDCLKAWDEHPLQPLIQRHAVMAERCCAFEGFAVRRQIGPPAQLLKFILEPL